MSITITIDLTIASLRRAAGATQEDVANAVGVSPQAVSKWENGGAPDAELLPSIADYFNVPIDALFGRGVDRFNTIEDALMKYFENIDIDERPGVLMELLWTVQQALAHPEVKTFFTLQKAEEQTYGHPTYTEINTNTGYIHARITKPLRYYFAMEKPENGYFSVLPDKAEFQKLFSELAKPEALSSLFDLYEKSQKNPQAQRPFTLSSFAETRQVSAEKADEVIRMMMNYRLVSENELELEDGILNYYHFRPNPVLYAMLAIAAALIERPSSWYIYIGGGDLDDIEE